MKNKHNQIDMSRGPLLGKIIRYAIPLALAYVLQLAFQAADMVVIGRWGSPASLAAIGATAPLLGLLINIFVGVSAGANVLAAQYYGAQDCRRLNRMLHTTIAMSIVCGIAIAILGIAIMRFLVDITNVPPESHDRAITYLIICFLGVPAQVIYNFGCAILRAIGNTKGPLYYLIASGIINLLLNLFFVIVFGWDVAGVAAATAISHGVSAFLVLRRLQHNRGATRLNWRRLNLDMASLKGILQIGVPAGVQSGCFSISNVVVQSGINTFGVAAVAGMTVALNIEWLLYALVFAMNHTITAAVGQNYGANKPHRIVQSIWFCSAISFLITLVFGNLMYLFAGPIVSVFNTDPEVIHFGILRAKELFTVYFCLGFMDMGTGALRGLGNSLLPACSTILGTCGLRILWVKYIFPNYGTMESLLLVYPLSWTLVAICNAALLYYLCRKIVRNEPTCFLKPI